MRRTHRIGTKAQRAVLAMMFSTVTFQTTSDIDTRSLWVSRASSRPVLPPTTVRCCGQ